MNTSEAVSEIIPALLLAKKSFKEPVKDSVNTYEGNAYASLNANLDSVSGALSDNKLLVTQYTELIATQQNQGEPLTAIDIAYQLCVVSRIWHESGQWLESSVTVSPQKAKNGSITPKAIGSAITYGRRYGLRCLLCLGDTESDDDGNQASQDQPAQDGEKITPEQIGQLDKLMEKAGADYQKFCEFLKVPSIPDMKQTAFPLAMNALKRKIGALKGDK